MQFVNQKPEKSGVIVAKYNACSVTIIASFSDVFLVVVVMWVNLKSKFVNVMSYHIVR